MRGPVLALAALLVAALTVAVAGAANLPGGTSIDISITAPATAPAAGFDVTGTASVGSGVAVANTTLAHERGTNFPFKEQVVHENHLQDLYELAARRGVLDDPEVADGLARAFVALRVLRLHNWRTLSRLGHGHERP